MKTKQFTNQVARVVDTDTQPIGVDVVARVLRCVGDELACMSPAEAMETVAELVSRAELRKKMA